MRVTTEILGNEATVVVEDEGTGANAVRTDTVTVDVNGRLTYAAFEGKTIDFIKRYFRGDVDGTNIIGRNSTTLFSDGVLTVGTFLAGQSVNILQLGETFYTSDAKVFADQSEQSAANALTSANNAATSETNAENAEIAAEAARDEIVAKIPFDEFTNGSIPKWNNANQDFENQADWLEDVNAGTNVSIDKTDPRNPVISASSPSSFTWAPTPGYFDNEPEAANATAPSGQTYSTIDGFKCVPITAQNSSDSVLTIYLSYLCEVSDLQYNRFRAFVDVNNWFEIAISSRRWLIRENVAGTITTKEDVTVFGSNIARFNIVPAILGMNLGTRDGGFVAFLNPLAGHQSSVNTSFDFDEFTHFGFASDITSRTQIYSLGVKTFNVSI